MTNSKNLLAELEHEMVSTGKLLESVPTDKLNWQPHPKSMTLGELALHVATISGGIAKYADNGTTTVEVLINHPAPKSKDEILSSFKNSIGKAKQVLNDATTEWESKTWNLTKNENIIFTLPRPLFQRLLMFNHLYHHRGQLTTYLRILDIALPSVYGPSADENPFA